MIKKLGVWTFPFCNQNLFYLVTGVIIIQTVSVHDYSLFQYHAGGEERSEVEGHSL